MKIAKKIGYEGVIHLTGSLHACVQGTYDGKTYRYSACPDSETGLVKDMKYIDFSQYR